MLVLRHLPDRFGRPRRSPAAVTRLRGLVAGVVAVAVFAFALVAVELGRIIEDNEVDRSSRPSPRAARTGTIWVLPLDRLVRIRTGETGDDAL